ncbi:MAG TPA: hypothetical protein VNN22_15605 [Verrucomicrobiae bacterium]|nr:hypothetical protein [Verrucomicrobiae bacterium]
MNQKHNQHQKTVKFVLQLARRRSWILLAFLTLALTGCSLLKFNRTPPTANVSSLQLSGNAPTGPLALTVVQAQIMRFADTYSATIAQACDDVTASTTNSALRLAVLRWKLGQSTAAYVNATGPNPAVNALDMLVLATMARMVIQDYGVDTFGDAILPLLVAQQRLETNVWTMASGVLKPAQQKELKDLILEWRAKNPHQRYIGPIRFREFVSALGRAPTKANSGPTSLFSLLYLDPLAGLDPTAAAIEETRELGERAMYYSQRMPMLLSWQVEVLASQLANLPESKEVLNDADRLATSADMFAKTAQQLPQLVNDQRQAAIQQILDGLTEQGNKSRELLTDTRSTLDSARDASASINTTIKSLTEFVQYVSPTNGSRASATNSKPFNVLDYGTAAAQVGVAANNLNTLLTTMNQSAPELTRLQQQTRAHADQLVTHAFWLGVILILILLAGAVVAGLVYRSLANKMSAGRKPSEP